MDQGRLKNRVAIITGAARGIGKATAIKMTNEGASVALLDILSREVAQVAEELNEVGGDALGLTIDVSCKHEVDKMTKLVLERFDTVDILVNNAGVVCPAPIEEVKEEDCDNVIKVNLKGSLFCAQAVVPIMKKNRSGRIVNVGSRASLGKLDRTVYSATKAGLIGITRTWALELAPYNINVNYVGPGPIATELFASANPEDSENTKAILNEIPLKRMGKPEEVAHLISFLASEEASFITGQTMFICGGMTVGTAHY